MKDNIDAFLKLENELNMFEKNIDGFHYWIAVRIGIYNDLINRQSDHNEKKEGANRSIYEAIVLLKDTVKSYLKFQLRKKNETEILLLGTNRFFDIPDQGAVEGYTWAIWNKFKSLTLYCTLYQKDKRNEPFDEMYSLDFIKNKAKILSKIQVKNGKKYRDYYDLIYDDIYTFFKKYNAETDEYIINKTINEIVLLYYEYKTASKAFKKILCDFGIKMIVEVCYYDRFHIYLNHVAKNLGINVIELQHGLMGSKHLAYNFEPIETHLTGFPDNVLLFSQYWKDTTRLPLSEHNAIVVGFPMFDAMIRKNLREGKNCDKVNNILFISQWTVSSQMYDFAVKLSKNEKLNKYNIIYKLHPFEKKENFTNFPKIKIIGNEQSVYDLFPLARVQVGAYSTALYEGLGFGLPTFIISSLDEEENMKALHDEGFCDYVDTPEELVEKMENSAQSLPNDFWEKNAEKNMIDEIERLLWMQKE